MTQTKITAICVTCGKTFPTRKSNKHGECLKCHAKVYQRKYFAQKRAVDPEWDKKRNEKNCIYALGTKTKLRLARIAMDKLLVRVQKQQAKIKEIEEEAKNGK